MAGVYLLVPVYRSIIKNPQNLRVRREQISLSAKNNEKLAVNILCLVGG